MKLQPGNSLVLKYDDSLSIYSANIKRSFFDQVGIAENYLPVPKPIHRQKFMLTGAPKRCSFELYPVPRCRRLGLVAVFAAGKKPKAAKNLEVGSAEVDGRAQQADG